MSNPVIRRIPPIAAVRAIAAAIGEAPRRGNHCRLLSFALKNRIIRLREADTAKCISNPAVTVRPAARPTHP